MGARAKHAGTSFESFIKLVVEGYHKLGIARIEKVDPPTVIRRRGPNGPTFVVQLENPFLDFIGTWTEQGGRAIFIEAKSTEKPRLPVNVDGGVTPTQYAALQQWEAAGAAVGVLWLHKGEVRLVTTSVMAAVRAEGRASVPWAEAYPIPQGIGLIHFDFLATMAGVLGLPRRQNEPTLREPNQIT